MFIKRAGLENHPNQEFKLPEADKDASRNKAVEVRKRTLEDTGNHGAPDRTDGLKEKKVAPYIIFNGNAPYNFSGFAELRYSDDKVYIGQFERGIPFGPGKYIFANKTTLEAIWGDKTSPEKITITYPNKQQVVYEGGWEHDKPHGKGKLSFTNGDYFEGQWEMGTLVEGEGQLRDASGFYRGHFKNGKRDGKGVLVSDNGSEYYLGEFKEGYIHGQGQTKFRSGHMHIGSFEKNLRQGEGIFYNKDTEEIYCGSWENNILEGPMTYTDPQGTIFDCVYKQGVCIIKTPRNPTYTPTPKV